MRIKTFPMTERVPSIQCSKHLVLGTYAFLHAPKQSEKTSDLFRWTVLLRSGDNPFENLSYFIKSVEFTLHSTFAHPKRLIEQAPFEVTEIGWGEFEILAKISFHDTQERPIELKHTLKLRGDTEPVVSETYEEVVFNAPHEWFYEKLSRPVLWNEEHVLQKYFQASFTDDYEHLLKVHDFLQSQIAAEVDALYRLENLIRPQLSSK
jgi:YEATS domain-containing protein 4